MRGQVLFLILVLPFHLLYANSSQQVFSVHAKYATNLPEKPQDIIDDPAICINEENPDQSIIVCTNKDKEHGGLLLYDLSANYLNFLPDGRMNNVDVRNVLLSGEKKSIIVATQRTKKSLEIYQVDFNHQTLQHLKTIKLDIKPYGGCLYYGQDSQLYFFVTDKNGNVQQWLLTQNHQLGEGKLVRTITLQSQSEGCVADDEQQFVYIAEESNAIWKYQAEPINDTQVKIDGIGVHLKADIEGLTLYKSATQGFLIASSQGNSTYVIYNAYAPHQYLGTFRIAPNGNMEGSEKTDGIAASSYALNKNFPQGIFIAHDNRESKGGGSNLKYVSWEDIAEALSLNKPAG